MICSINDQSEEAEEGLQRIDKITGNAEGIEEISGAGEEEEDDEDEESESEDVKTKKKTKSSKTKNHEEAKPNTTQKLATLNMKNSSLNQPNQAISSNL